METLLSLSFDNISSKDSNKIRKGLKQIEGLLAQICLSSSRPTSSSRRRGSVVSPAPSQQQQQQQPAPAKNLRALADDPAFREFFRLQEGFECNVATRLIACLDRLLGMGNTDEMDLVIVSALNVLQGILLLHPPSRALFSREIYMNLLLDLLDPYNCPAIQSAGLLVLVTALLATPQNTRTFENLDGLLTVTSLFKARDTAQTVKLKVVEFLYFYLMPEMPPSAGSSGGGMARGSNKLLAAAALFERRRCSRDETRSPTPEETYLASCTRCSAEKQRLLGRYLGSDVLDDLVQDLRESAPFGEAVRS